MPSGGAGMLAPGWLVEVVEILLLLLEVVVVVVEVVVLLLLVLLLPPAPGDTETLVNLSHDNDEYCVSKPCADEKQSRQRIIFSQRKAE